MPHWTSMRLALAALLALGAMAGVTRAEAAETAAAEVEQADDFAAVGPAAADHAAGAHGGAHDHHDPYDLSHLNATAALEDPTEIRSDLAIWTLVVFVLLLLLLLKFAWRPIMEGLEKREQSIAGMINEAKLSADKAAEQLRQYEARLAAASAEAQQIIARAQQDAEAAGVQIIAEARAAAQRDRERAVADIENAKHTALHEITQRSVDLATAMASRIVRRQLQPEDQAQLIRETLDQLPSRN